jgi:hypothetical protein
MSIFLARFGGQVAAVPKPTMRILRRDTRERLSNRLQQGFSGPCSQRRSQAFTLEKASSMGAKSGE